MKKNNSFFFFGIILLLTLKYISSNPNLIKWPSKKIPVCWEKSTAKYVTEKEWVKNAITNTWQKESALEFTSWCPCESKMPGIHITVNDNKRGPDVKELGALINGLPDGMTLNFTFKQWGTGLPRMLGNSRKKAIEIVAIHEFGHALGFTHQQQRKNCYLCDRTDYAGEFPKIEKANKVYNDNGLWPTSCDRHSVMNYCNNEYGNNGVLSTQDINAVRFVYGPPRVTTKNSISLYYSATPLQKIKNSNADYKNLADEKKSKQEEKYPPRVVKQDNKDVIQDNKDEYTVYKYRWYEINMHLNAPSATIAKIEKVEYFLDPTFKAKSFNIRNSATNFKIAFTVWGGFTVKAKLYYKDGSTQNVEQRLDSIPPFKATLRKTKSSSETSIEEFESKEEKKNKDTTQNKGARVVGKKPNNK